MHKPGVAIFGGGYVGSNLYNELQKSTKLESFLINKEKLDYTKESKLREFFESCEPNFVVNCVGFTGRPNVDACELNKEETYKLNVQLPILMAKLCEEYRASLFHVSSGCIYSGYNKPYTEDDVPDFGVFNDQSSFYSKTKHAAELALQNYTLNICNPEPLYTQQIVEIYKEHNFANSSWSYIPYDQMPIKANRSNCIMSVNKMKDFGLVMDDERTAITKSLISLRDNA